MRLRGFGSGLWFRSSLRHHGFGSAGFDRARFHWTRLLRTRLLPMLCGLLGTFGLLLVYPRRIGAALFVTWPVIARPIVAGWARSRFRRFNQTGVVIADMVHNVVGRDDRLFIGRHIPELGAIVGPILAARVTLFAALIIAMLTALVVPLITVALWSVALLVLAVLVATVLVATILVAGVLVATVLIIGLLIVLAAFLLRRHLAVGFGQKARVMLGMLQKVLGGDAVI